MPFVKVNGIKHHYMQQGSGPDVVLIHGMGGNLSFWHANKAFLTLQEDFRVTIYDLRGHGYSEFASEGYTSRELAGDLAALMDAIGLEKSYLTGHSLGGTVAMHAAYLYPEKVSGLILTEAAIPAVNHLIDLKTWPYRRQREEMLRAIDPRLPELLEGNSMYYLEYRLKSVKGKDADPDLADFGLRKGMSLKAKSVLRLLDETTIKKDVRRVAGLTEARVRTVTHPILALYGEYSPLIPISNFLRDNMANCQQVVIPEACHLFPARMPDKFVGSLRSFLLDMVKGEQREVQYAAL